MAIPGTDVSWLNLLGPVGGLVSGLQRSNFGQVGSSTLPGVLGNVANVAQNFGLASTKPAGAFEATADYGLNPTQEQQQSIINKATSQSNLPQVDLNQQSGGGNNSGFSMDYYQGWDPTAAQADWNATGGAKARQSSGPSYEDIMRSQIDSGYNSYFSELDNMLGGLDAQRQAQENIANNSFNSNVTDLGLQRTQNLNELGTQERKTEESQVKTLKDISNNIRNLMQAGNTYLGARGAGDSSAVNQYGYALTKLGSQQRGDVMGQTRQIMSDINDRKSRLDNVFMQEKNRLTVEKDNAIQGVASWFADAQNQLRQAKAQGQLNKSQDLQALTTNLYNQAVQQLANIQNQTAQRQAQLESWALNNSKSLAEAKANLAGIAKYSAPTQSFSPISGTPRFDQQGNMGVDFRGGVGTGFGLTEDQKRLLGIA